MEELRKEQEKLKKQRKKLERERKKEERKSDKQADDIEHDLTTKKKDKVEKLDSEEKSERL